MHKVGGILYYDGFDSHQLMADIYNTTLMKHPDEAVRNMRTSYMSAFYTVLNKNGPAYAANLLNIRITECIAPTYEAQWQKLFQAYGFDCYVSVVNGLAFAGLLGVPNVIEKTSNEYKEKCSRIANTFSHETGTRYFAISLASHTIFKKDQNLKEDITHPLLLDIDMVSLLVDEFEGSFYDTEDKIFYLKYGPCHTVLPLIYITNIFHYFM